MTPRTKKLVLLLGVLWGVPILLAAGMAWWVHSAGTVTVEVTEHRAGGSDVRIHIPGALAQACLWLVPDAALAEVDRDVRRAGPASDVIRALSRELKNCPDAVFVDVASVDETVRLAKKDRYLVVNVDSADETVHIRVPIAIVASAMTRIDGHGCFRGDGTGHGRINCGRRIVGI